MNAYLLLDDPVTLIDTGIWQPDSVRQLQAAIEAAGIRWSDIAQVVVTHMHGDHAGGVPFIQKQVAVPVYVHEMARFTLEGGLPEFERVESYFQQFFRECGADGRIGRNAKFRETKWEQVHYVTDGDTLSAGGRDLDVIYVPGHSQTDICLWDAESGDAFVGDHLLKDISANAFMEPSAPPQNERSKALLQLRDSMLRTKQFPFETIYPGHGGSYVGHVSLIEERFAEQESRCETILEHLHSGKRTVYDLSTTMFPWLTGPAVFLGLSEVMGHLDLLIEQSKVTAIKGVGDVMMFQPV